MTERELCPQLPSSSASIVQPDAAVEKPVNKEGLAIHLDIDIKTVERWMRDGVLPYTKIGRIVRFYRTDVDAALKKSHGQNYPRH